MKCNWCKGTGWVQLYFRGRIDCPNCKGLGQGPDGGKTKLREGKRLNMIGNQYAKKEMP